MAVGGDRPQYTSSWDDTSMWNQLYVHVSLCSRSSGGGVWVQPHGPDLPAAVQRAQVLQTFVSLFSTFVLLMPAQLLVFWGFLSPSGWDKWTLGAGRIPRLCSLHHYRVSPRPRWTPELVSMCQSKAVPLRWRAPLTRTGICTDSTQVPQKEEWLEQRVRGELWETSCCDLDALPLPQLLSSSLKAHSEALALPSFTCCRSLFCPSLVKEWRARNHERRFWFDYTVH